jgi:hypothetical protein
MAALRKSRKTKIASVGKDARDQLNQVRALQQIQRCPPLVSMIRQVSEPWAISLP